MGTKVFFIFIVGVIILGVTIGFGMPSTGSLILIVLFFIFIWFSLKLSKYSFSFFKRINNDTSSHERKNCQSNIDNNISFISNNLTNEIDIISSEEEIPLDNRYGSSPLVSEFEISKTTSTIFKLNKNKIIKGKVKTNLWMLVEIGCSSGTFLDLSKKRDNKRNRY